MAEGLGDPDAGLDPPGYQFKQFVLAIGSNLVARNGAADIDGDASWSWQLSATRPRLIRPGDSHRHDRGPRSAYEDAEARLQGTYPPVLRPRPLGKDQRGFALFEPSDDLPEARYTPAVPIDGDCVDGADQQAERPAK
jgi:hypothetical protein